MSRGRSTGRVLIIVENVAAFTDHRVSKQVATLLQAGYRVVAISRRAEPGAEQRRHPRLRLLEYRAPAEPRRRIGYLREYAYSLLAATWFAFRVVVRERPDVVQFCQPPDLYFPLAMVCRALGVRVLVDQRDLLPELYAARYGQPRPAVLAVLRRMERLSLAWADRVTCVNGYLRQRALDLGAIGAERITVIGNGPVLARVTGVRGDAELRQGQRFLA
jgi:hypothetical protein